MPGKNNRRHSQNRYNFLSANCFAEEKHIESGIWHAITLDTEETAIKKSRIRFCFALLVTLYSVGSWNVLLFAKRFSAEGASVCKI
jgi:hypothetical protein